MKKQVIYCPKCKKHVELIREVLRTPNGTFDKVVSLCAKCGEALAIIAVKYLPEGDPFKEVLCEEKQSKPAPKGNIQKVTVEPEEKPLRCSIELSAQIVREIVTELKGIRETLEKQNKWEQKMTRLDKTLAVTKQCQDKFTEFNISWVMNNISKTIDMHLIPRIEEAKDQEDIRYCQGMLDAISDLLTDKLCNEIQSKIYSKQIQLGELPF